MVSIQFHEYIWSKYLVCFVLLAPYSSPQSYSSPCPNVVPGILPWSILWPNLLVSASWLRSWHLSKSTAAAKLLQLCLTLCDPIEGSPPGSPILGILQARTPEWVANLRQIQTPFLKLTWCKRQRQPQTGALWKPRRVEWGRIAEGGLPREGHMYTYGRLMLMYSKNHHNTLK